MKFLKIVDGHKNNKVEYIDVAEIGKILLSFSYVEGIVEGCLISIERKGVSQDITIKVKERIMAESNIDKISEQIKKDFVAYFEGKLQEISGLNTSDKIFMELNKDDLELFYEKVVRDAEGKHY